MFTGLITDVGTLREHAPGPPARLVVDTGFQTDRIPIGASVSHGGVCLTVTDRGLGWLATEVSPETLDRTAIGGWRPGHRINLEQSLRLGDELGGHLVFGHVDGLARVAAITDDGGSWRFWFDLPPDLARFVAPKGSVALDGVSLTVNTVEDGSGGAARIGITVIPHTWSHTSLRFLAQGDPVHVEIDMLARYVARQLGPTLAPGAGARP